MLVLVSRTKSVYSWTERFDFTYVLKNKQLLHVHHLVNPVILVKFSFSEFVECEVEFLVFM